MHRQVRYPLQKNLPRLLEAIGVNPEQVLRRCNFASDFFERDTRGITGMQCVQIWEAALDALNNPHSVIDMARTLARGPFVPAAFAFSCSPNIVTGLERLAVFKPLIAPIRLNVTRLEERVVLEIDVADPSLHLPYEMAAFEMVYFMELGRLHTGVEFVPAAVGIPRLLAHQDVYDSYYGCKATVTRLPTLTLHTADAHLPLTSENPQLWSGFERELRRQLADHQRNTAMSARVRGALMELLPVGQASVDAVCTRLVTSRRSLQRHLNKEGLTFQSVLDTTRADLALRYLRQGDLSIEEISYLLAYRDPNSFYRAFQNWTGSTPARMRDTLGQAVA